MITTHVLDTSRGGAAVGIAVVLELREALQWNVVGRGVTDANGRVTSLMPERPLVRGRAPGSRTYGAAGATTLGARLATLVRPRWRRWMN